MTYILVIVFKISQMEKVLISTPMVVNNTKEIGLEIDNTALELKHIKTVLVTKDNINKGKKMDKEHSIGLTDLYIKDNFLTIICMAKVYISGLMVDLMMVNGTIIRWTVKEYLNGLMVENI